MEGCVFPVGLRSLSIFHLWFHLSHLEKTLPVAVPGSWALTEGASWPAGPGQPWLDLPMAYVACSDHQLCPHPGLIPSGSGPGASPRA